jgi:hypothetical protein
MGTLQQWLWEEAPTVADDLLDCELDAVLKYIPDLAISGPADLDNEDLDRFLDHCRRILGCYAINLHLPCARRFDT